MLKQVMTAALLNAQKQIRVSRSETSPVPVPVKGCQFFFYICSERMPIEQWGFFNVPHLLWHGASLNDGHQRGDVILTPVAERLAVELSLPVFTTLVFCGWDSNTQSSAWKANALAHCTTAVVKNCCIAELFMYYVLPVIPHYYFRQFSTVLQYVSRYSLWLLPYANRLCSN